MISVSVSTFHPTVSNMKKRSFLRSSRAFTLAVLLLAGTSFLPHPAQAAVPAADQVIKNGDFENCRPDVMSGTGTVTSFTFGSGGGATPPTFQCRDSQGTDGFTQLPASLGGTAHTGNRAVYGQNTAGTTVGSFAFLFSNVGETKVEPGQSITLNSFYRTSAAFNGALEHIEIKMEFKNAAGATITTALPTSATCPNAPGGGGNITPTGAVATNCRVTGVAPAGTESVIAVLVLAKDGAGATGEVFFDSFSINTANTFTFNIASNREQIERGQPFVITGQVNNGLAVPVNDVQIVGKLPSGLQYVRNSARVNGNPAEVQAGSIVINMGQVPFGMSSNFSFTAIATQGVQVGKSYEITLDARDGSSFEHLARSNRVVLRITPDAFFDLGTIIGKVFNDKNSNGVQDKGEEGIPMVRLATEQGMVVTTDEFGKYHIPAVTPGQHLVKIDGRTLPEGTQFVTEQAYLVKVTEGLLAKASFAVKMPENSNQPAELKDLVKFRVVPEDDNAKPELSVRIGNPIVYIASGQTKTPIHFFMSTNYSAIVHHWKLEVRNEMGQVVWSGIGEGAPPGEVVWDGKDNAGNLLEGDEVYSYRLMVADPDFREDWTDLSLFRTVSMKVGEENFPGVDLPATGYFHMARYGKRDISHESQHSVKVVGKVLKDPKTVNLHINDESVVVNKDGTFIHDVYLPSGQSEVNIATTNDEGDQMTYGETMSLKSTSFFFVGLTEGTLNFNNFNGDQATLAQAGQYDAFDPDGRIAFYGQMRWKDRLRVTTSLDTTKQNSNILFTNLDPFHLYQTYGDNSTINYEAFDTQDHFFIMAESDKSFIRWGNFNTGFDDFELAQYNRTLAGLKVHYESPKSTVYCEPKADLTGFEATARQLPDHVEILGTGGSLYYLRNINVVEGSDKVKVQVRDKTTNLVLQEKDLISGTDYEINYQEGRIILSKPLSSVVDTDSVIDNLILNGDQAYLVVDYEYQPARGRFVDGLTGTTRGLKGHLAFGDKVNVRVGGVYVEDKTLALEDGNKIRGISAELKALFNTRIRAEYAEQNGLLTDNEYSYDGGFNYTNLSLARKFGDNGSIFDLSNSTSPSGREKSYLIKGESKPLKHLDLSGYYQVTEPFFSNSEIVSQRGNKKYGVEAQYRMTPHWGLKFRYDNQNEVRAKQPNVVQTPLLSPFFLDADRIQTTTLQSNYHRNKWDWTTEYQYQKIDNPTTANVNIFNELLDSNQNFDHAIGTKLAYKVSDKFTPYIRGQVTAGGGKNNQVGAGLHSQLTNKMSGFAEETIGNIGDGTRFGFENRVSDDTSVYSTFGVENNRSLQDKIFRSTVGTATDFADRHRIYTERQLTNYRQEQVFSDIAGHRMNWTENFYTDTRFERAAVNAYGNYIDRSVGSIQLGYSLTDRFNNTNKFEVRYDKGNQHLLQWLYTGDLNWKINDNLTQRTSLQFSQTTDSSNHNTYGRFVEFGSGFAYRPLDSDKLNFLFNYNYLQVMPLAIQYSTLFAPDNFYNFGVQTDERSHTVSLEGIYDLNRWLGFVEKIALKRGWLDTPVTDPTSVFQLLWLNRINFHVTRKWDLGLEYRLRIDREALATNRSGLLVELDREVLDHIRFGVGFNFTDFSDELNENTNYNNRGFFARMTGTF